MLFVALGSCTYGYCSSIISVTLGQPSFITYFELDKKPNASDLLGTINGVFQAGGFIGTLSCLGTADWLGRRKALLVAAILTVVGGALQAGSVNIGMYIAMRAITGMGIGKKPSSVRLKRRILTANRCPGDFGAPLPERNCTTKDPRPPSWYAWDDDWYRLCRCMLRWARVLLCQCFRCTMAYSPGHSVSATIASCMRYHDAP